MMTDKELHKNIPETPGVYIMKDKDSKIIYIGKAANLKKRVRSYFTSSHNRRTEKLVSKIENIEYKKTDNALEALILEADLIKKYKPPFNVKEKDDRSFLWVEITDEKFPRVLLVRGKKEPKGKRFGPFTSSSSIRRAMKILRKIFPYNTHKPEKIGEYKRPCTYAQIGLCPGTCTGDIKREEYLENIKNLKKVLKGKMKSLIKNLEKQMKKASDNKNFEKAQKFKEQLFALKHIEDTALITEPEIRSSKKRRIEAYDISNISGKYAAGSMVAFKGRTPDKSQYRKFKIKTIKQQNDVGMLKEVFQRRLEHKEWPYPYLIVVDGGKPQKNATEEVLEEKGIKIPVLGIAKGEKRNKNEIIGERPENINKKTLIRLRDEAHRFALAYHKKLRRKKLK